MSLNPEDKAKIDAMGHHTMAQYLRHHTLLSFPWDDADAADYFMERWNSFEGQNECDSD